MPRKQTRIMVRVDDSGAKEGLRKLQVEIEGDESQFETSDFCAKEGVVADLASLLKGTVKDAVLKYIESGSEVLRSVRERPQENKATRKLVTRVSVPAGVEH